MSIRIRNNSSLIKLNRNLYRNVYLCVYEAEENVHMFLAPLLACLRRNKGHCVLSALFGKHFELF